jgi:LysR family hca operon transcriptional activator
MELRHLRYFVAVADELSFTKGAEKLRIAQPSMTRQIRDLEEELGVRLLDRTKKKVTLTREGEFFLERAKRLLGFGAEMVRSVHELDHKASQVVNIGYVANPFHRLLPDSLTAFEKQFPDISINLFGMPPPEQISAVADGKLDIGFVGLLDSMQHSDLQFLPVASYPGVALLPKASSQAKRKIVNLKDVAQTSFITLSDKCYPGYSRWFTETCGQVGIKGKILQVLDSDSALIQAVRSGLGIALLPEQIRDVPHENILIKNVTPSVAFSSTIVWKKNNSSPALKAYLQTMTSMKNKSDFHPPLEQSLAGL